MDEMSLADINIKLTSLPGEISRKKISWETLKNKYEHESAKMMLQLDRKEYPNADLRKAFIEADERIYKLKDLISRAEATYYEDVNFFQGVQERARNVRMEMKSGMEGGV